MSGPKPLTIGYVKPRILAALEDAGGDYIRTREIIDRVWTMHDLDGPMDAIAAVARAVKQLRSYGYEIGAGRGGHSPGYRLIGTSLACD